MGRLVVAEFVTVDGVMEAPGTEAHRAGRNAWSLRIQDEETHRYLLEAHLATEALLIGRTTYQIWAAYFASAPPDDPFTRVMTALPKYVVSTTLTETPWANSHLLKGDLGIAVRDLKDRHRGEIRVEGSAELVDALLHLDLIDEYRLLVHPLILGSGKRLFRDDIEQHDLELVDSRIFTSGIVLLIYRPASVAPTGRWLERFAWTEEMTYSLQAAQNVDRVLATILFTDIVGSTARASDLGDRAWRDVLDRHDEISLAEVSRWHGRLVKSTGDGILATFDAPTRALRCAFDLLARLAGMDLEARAAIHTGEVELRKGDVGGIGVHIAARALAEAHRGQVVVTRTVRDLASGSDLSFSALGSVSLRGVPGRWELYSAAIR